MIHSSVVWCCYIDSFFSWVQANISNGQQMALLTAESDSSNSVVGQVCQYVNKVHLGRS